MPAAWVGPGCREKRVNFRRDRWLHGPDSESPTGKAGRHSRSTVAGLGEKRRLFFLYSELADKEQAEIDVIQEFLPTQLTEAEITALVADAVSKTGAESVKDMGKVMGIIKPQVQGRADMGLVSKVVKTQLG